MVHMLPITLLMPSEVGRTVAERARALRLLRNHTQAGLAQRAGVSLGSLKRFERTGAIAFEALVRIAIALDATAELETWFSPPPFRSIDDAITRQKRRQRGRT